MVLHRGPAPAPACLPGRARPRPALPNDPSASRLNHVLPGQARANRRATSVWQYPHPSRTQPLCLQASRAALPPSTRSRCSGGNTPTLRQRAIRPRAGRSGFSHREPRSPRTWRPRTPSGSQVSSRTCNRRACARSTRARSRRHGSGGRRCPAFRVALDHAVDSAGHGHATHAAGRPRAGCFARGCLTSSANGFADRLCPSSTKNVRRLWRLSNLLLRGIREG